MPDASRKELSNASGLSAMMTASMADPNEQPWDGAHSTQTSALAWLFIGTVMGATAGVLFLSAWQAAGHSVALVPGTVGSLFGGAHVGVLSAAGLLALR